MNKKIIATLAATVFLLSACSDPTGESTTTDPANPTGKTTKTTTTSHQLSNDYYKTVVNNRNINLSNL